MGVSKAQVAENRHAIVETAARVFRARGVDGIGVVDLMKEAGFTHGGFYNHFESKEALAAEACDAAFAQSLSAFDQMVERNREDDAKILHDLLEHYMSSTYRDDPGAACPTSALAVDAARHGEQLQEAYARSIETMVDILSRYLPSLEKTKEAAGDVRARALDLLSSMIGSMVIARGVARVNKPLSDEILEVRRRRLPA